MTQDEFNKIKAALGTMFTIYKDGACYVPANSVLYLLSAFVEESSDDIEDIGPINNLDKLDWSGM